MNDEDKTKMLNLMRFWLFGTFVIVFAAVTVYAGGVWKTGLEIFKESGYWGIILSTAALCVIWFYGYRWYLNRK